MLNSMFKTMGVLALIFALWALWTLHKEGSEKLEKGLNAANTFVQNEVFKKKGQQEGRDTNKAHKSQDEGNDYPSAENKDIDEAHMNTTGDSHLDQKLTSKAESLQCAKGENFQVAHGREGHGSKATPFTETLLPPQYSDCPIVVPPGHNFPDESHDKLDQDITVHIVEPTEEQLQSAQKRISEAILRLEAVTSNFWR